MLLLMSIHPTITAYSSLGPLGQWVGLYISAKLWFIGVIVIFDAATASHLMICIDNFLWCVPSSSSSSSSLLSRGSDTTVSCEISEWV